MFTVICALLVKLNRIVLAFFGLSVIRSSTLKDLETKANHNSIFDLKFLSSQDEKHVGRCIQFLSKSKSQLRQDLFVLIESNWKKNGFFVEFGAANGERISNTFLLEKEFAWTGILVEPARCFHRELELNRPDSQKNFKCVWRESGVLLDFVETSESELSTINDFASVDFHSKSRKNGHIYQVETISLFDLLSIHNAPKYIDYLSIDTEGSELEILRSLDFSIYKFGIITVEHNYTSGRDEIFELLSKFGYQRKFTELSKFEDWYIDPLIIGINE